jgi:hypothetical protein
VRAGMLGAIGSTPFVRILVESGLEYLAGDLYS